MNKQVAIENEKWFQAILELSTDAVAVISQEGIFSYVTISIEAVLGYTNAEARKLDIFSLTHPNDRDRLSGVWEEMVNTINKVLPPQTFRMKHKNGSWRLIESSIKNMLHDPAVYGVVINLRDVTERVAKANQNLIEKNNLEALINNTRDFMWSIDCNFKLIAANNAFVDIISLITSRAVSIGDSIFIEGFPGDHHEKYKKTYERVFKGEVITEVEYTGPPAEIWSEIIYYPIWEKNVVIGAACHSKNISPIKKAEQERIRNEARLKESQALAKLGHWELDFATGKALWSEETCRIYGLPIDDIFHTYEEWLGFIHPDDLEYVLAEIEISQKTYITRELNHRIKLRDGTVKHIASKTKYEFDETGNIPEGIYGVAYDITAVKVAELELKQKARELALSNAELEQFAYAVSHDLQEPLRMVTGFMSQLEFKYSDVLDNKAKEYIFYAVDGAKRMRQVILDMLEYSRVGKTDEELVDVDLGEAVEEIKVLLKNQIEDKKAIVQYNTLPVIRSNKTPLHQIFQNLISNGLKYTEKGVVPQIKIVANEEIDHWIFSVSDNGIGINERDFEKVFAIFQRLHSKSEFPGTGIGLATTKKIIEHLGGSIWLESIVDKGSVFYFTLPKANGDRAVCQNF
ncbi:PAS domain-containing sensor histidine kinase [Lunatibacter salilacus]|uniref:PAS domain-containing sensor histidine kinase n=1 Tax=Lunatibacter salilacus TaxID=2483804 RepID=UPI00131B39DF|nr:PAS domain S-box protein [Lunatibacter salilacus]